MSKRLGNALIALGALCIALAVALLLRNDAEARRAAASSDAVLPVLAETIALRASQPEEPEPQPEEPAPEPIAELDGARYIGCLSVPALSLELPVRAEWSYPDLQESPCRYAGTAAEGGLCIAAHNFRRHFGAIGTLVPGDAVFFVDAAGTVWSYTVVEVTTLRPAETDAMRDSAWDLTLFTCTPGGASRVTVRCLRTAEE